MQIWFIRGLFILLGTASGYFVGSLKIGSAIIGLGISSALVGLEYFLKRSALRDLLVCLIGLIIGLSVASLVVYLGASIIKAPWFVVGISLICGYTGMMTMYRRRDELNIPFIAQQNTQSQKSYNSKSNDCKILDTSVLIDGRISDICQTRFIEGTLLVPRFILKELQYIADSTDSLRRNKGRRGFKVLDMMQNSPDIDMQIIEEDFPDVKEVDTKIIQLARECGAKVITNDFNLNKVAELQGVAVLNINELADSVKPMVLPSEVMSVRVIREGKESNQGVAYLDDGTMVIVEEGKRYVGQSIQVVVTTVLTTNAGRMIFTKKKGDEVENDNYDDYRNHSRGWNRRKNGYRY